MSKFIVVSECAIEYKNKFLIIKRPKAAHAGGLLSFPGGKFEVTDADNSTDAVKSGVRREVLEEVGIDLLDPIHYIRTNYFLSDSGEPVVIIIYHCKLEKTPIIVTPSPREVAEYYWLSNEEIKEKDNCPHWLKNYLESIKPSAEGQ
jgi:8-oxo-dGTP pyrophosphatase MutT (NUDIX family)